MRRSAKSNAASGTTTPTPAKVEAAAEQSRFHAATIDADGTEIDLHNVDLMVGGQELLVGARVLLEEGVKYGMIGRLVFRVLSGCGLMPQERVWQV